ncbi:MAG: tetratricopeptide repeat protein [Pseudomonadota bacterium]
MYRYLLAPIAALTLSTAACSQETVAPAPESGPAALCPDGFAALQSDTPGAAIDLLEACLSARQYPWRDELELRARLGAAHLVGGDGEQALFSFDQALGLLQDNGAGTDNPLLRRNRAAALLLLDRHEDALRDLETALSSPRTDAFTHLLHGSTLLELERAAEAVAAFDAAIRIEGDFIDAWAGRSAAFIDLELFDRAVEDGREAVAIDPEDATALNALCWSLVKAERAADGMEICEQAVAANPDSGSITHSLAAAREQVGETREARRLYALAFELDPDNDEIVADYERTRRR